MAWAGGTQTITRPANKVLSIVATNFDANGEYATAVDLTSYFKDTMPHRAVLHVDRTAGTTDVIAMSIQVSAFNDSDWQDLISATSSAGTLDYWITPDYGEPATAGSQKLYRYVRFYCTTVGNGNTLTASALLEARTA